MQRILHYIGKQARILSAVAFITYKEWAAYRSHMLVSLFVGPVVFAVQYFIWNAVYSQGQVINGLTLDQMLTYFALVTVIHYLVMDFADWNLHMLIHTGLFASYMIKPMSHIFFAFSQKAGHRVLGFVYEFIPVYFLFFFALGIELVPAHIGWTLLSVFLGFLMSFLINYSIGIVGFWLIRGEGVRRMIQTVSGLFRGVFIPLVFFPVPLQAALFFLPFQFACYVPIRVFLGSYELGGIYMQIPQIVGMQAVAVVLMFFATKALFIAGIRKFTGVGI